MTKNQKTILPFILATITVLSPVLAFADAGLPMLAVAWPLSWFAFMPIVAIECVVSWRYIILPWRKSLSGSLIANIASTIVGIPITWGLLLAVEIMATNGGRAYGLKTFSTKLLAVTVQAPWLIPYEEDLYWMVPSALLFLLPFFGIVSVFMERPIFRKFANCDKKEAKLWSWSANGITYGISIIAALIWLISGIVRHA
jgi:hypothetical protein